MQIILIVDHSIKKVNNLFNQSETAKIKLHHQILQSINIKNNTHNQFRKMLISSRHFKNSKSNTILTQNFTFLIIKNDQISIAF